MNREFTRHQKLPGFNTQGLPALPINVGDEINPSAIQGKCSLLFPLPDEAERDEGKSSAQRAREGQPAKSSCT